MPMTRVYTQVNGLTISAKCNRCKKKKIKVSSDFYTANIKYQKCGLNSICIQCEREKYIQEQLELGNVPLSLFNHGDSKTCIDCGKTKTLEYFIDGITCKKCRAKRQRVKIRLTRHLVDPNYKPKYTRTIVGDSQVCTQCGKLLSLKLFDKQKGLKVSGHRSVCKKCCKEIQKRYEGIVYPSYVKQIIATQYGIAKDEIPPEYVSIRTSLILINRKTKEIQNATK